MGIVPLPTLSDPLVRVCEVLAADDVARVSPRGLRYRAVLAVLPAVGRCEWAIEAVVDDVLRLRLPAKGWRWVALWLRWRARATRPGASAWWLDAPPVFGVRFGARQRLRRGVRALCRRYGLDAAAGEVARAGMPDPLREWTPRQRRRGNGPRCWPSRYEPIVWGEWVRRERVRGREWSARELGSVMLDS